MITEKVVSLGIILYLVHYKAGMCTESISKTYQVAFSKKRTLTLNEVFEFFFRHAKVSGGLVCGSFFSRNFRASSSSLALKFRVQDHYVFVLARIQTMCLD